MIEENVQFLKMLDIFIFRSLEDKYVYVQKDISELEMSIHLEQHIPAIVSLNVTNNHNIEGKQGRA